MSTKKRYKPIYKVGQRVVRSDARGMFFRGVVTYVMEVDTLPGVVKMLRSQGGPLEENGIAWNSYVQMLLKKDRDCFKNPWYVVQYDEKYRQKLNAETDTLIVLESELLPEKWDG